MSRRVYRSRRMRLSVSPPPWILRSTHPCPPLARKQIDLVGGIFNSRVVASRDTKIHSPGDLINLSGGASGVIDRIAAFIYHADRQTRHPHSGLDSTKDARSTWTPFEGRPLAIARACVCVTIRVNRRARESRGSCMYSMDGIGIGIYIVPRAGRLGFNWVN